MNVSSEFSRHALEYGNYNIIQNMVIEKLLSHVTYKPKRILDNGCGSGALINATNNNSHGEIVSVQTARAKAAVIVNGVRGNDGIRWVHIVWNETGARSS